MIREFFKVASLWAIGFTLFVFAIAPSTATLGLFLVFVVLAVAAFL